AYEEFDVRVRPAADVERAAAGFGRGETLHHARDDRALPTGPPGRVLVREHVAVLEVFHRIPVGGPTRAEADRPAHVLPAPVQETKRRGARLRHAMRSRHIRYGISTMRKPRLRARCRKSTQYLPYSPRSRILRTTR